MRLSTVFGDVLSNANIRITVLFGIEELFLACSGHNCSKQLNATKISGTFFHIRNDN